VCLHISFGKEAEEEEADLHLSSPEGMMRWVLTHGKPKHEADENQEEPYKP
jgi:hypothetical protein